MSNSTPEERLSHISARLSDITAIVVALQREIEDIYISLDDAIEGQAHCNGVTSQ